MGHPAPGAGRRHAVDRRSARPGRSTHSVRRSASRSGRGARGRRETQSLHAVVSRLPSRSPAEVTQVGPRWPRRNGSKSPRQRFPPLCRRVVGGSRSPPDSRGTLADGWTVRTARGVPTIPRGGEARNPVVPKPVSRLPPTPPLGAPVFWAEQQAGLTREHSQCAPAVNVGGPGGAANSAQTADFGRGAPSS